MPNIPELIKDPDFLSLPPEEQLKGLSFVDKDFAKLPPEEQFKGLKMLTSKQAPIPFVSTPPPSSQPAETGGTIEDFVRLQRERGIPEQEIRSEKGGMEAPFIDPVSAGVSAFAMPAKAGFMAARTAGKGLRGAIGAGIRKGIIPAAISALADIPIGQATDQIAKIDESYAFPFSVAVGLVSSATIENFLEESMVRAMGKRGSKIAVKAAAQKIQKAGKEGNYQKVSKAIKEFFSPTSTIPGSKDYLKLRYKTFGDIDTSERIVKQMFDKLKNFDTSVKGDIFRYLDGQIPLTEITPAAQKIAKSIHERTKTIGRMLVKRGIISQETFNAHEGEYVHYMYARHILGDDAAIPTSPTGKLDLSYAKKRKNLTPAERKALGLIEDVSIAAPVGLGKALTDIGKVDFFDSIAKNPDWVWTPSIVDVPTPDGKTVKWGIGKLAKEVDIYKKIARENPTNLDIANRFKQLSGALETAKGLAKNIPKDFKEMPNVASFGSLAGAYVRTPIYDDIVPIFSNVNAEETGKMFNALLKINQEGMRLFKASKAALNLPTAIRNTISNVMQNNLRGRPLAKILLSDIPNALTGMAKKDADYKMARRYGLFRTNWTNTEISNVTDVFKKINASKGLWAGFMNNVSSLAQYYGKIDDISKFAIFKQMRAKGVEVEDAVLEAQKWGMDYSLASRSVKGLRRHLMPFLSYQYKVTPLLAESLKKNPLTIAKYLSLPLVFAPYAAKKMLGIDEKEWEKLKKEIPSYIKENESYTILPWKDKNGKYQWVNLEYFFPWQNVLGVHRKISKKGLKGIEKQDVAIGNPFMDLAEAWNSGKDPFTGQPIYNKLEPPHKQWLSIAEFIYNKWAPSMLTRYGALGYTARIGEKDRWGKEITTPQALGRWGGVNIVTTTPQQTGASKVGEIYDYKGDLRKILLSPAKTKEEKTRAIKRFREETQRIIHGR